MSIKRDTIKPDTEISTKFLRKQRDLSIKARAIETINSVTEAGSAREGDESIADKSQKADEYGGKLTDSQKVKQEQLKKGLEVAKQSGHQKAAVQKLLGALGDQANSILAQAMIAVDPYALKLFKKANGQEELKTMHAKVLDKPENIAFAMQSSISSEMDAKRKEYENDPVKLEEAEEWYSSFQPMFEVLDALKGNGSHEKMIAFIDGVSDTISGMQESVNKYYGVVDDIGKTLRHHQALEVNNHNIHTQIPGVAAKGDKHLRSTYYLRTARYADGQGGIKGNMGLVYDYMEADVEAGSPFERYSV